MRTQQPGPPDAVQWYYLSRGEPCGPVSAGNLRQLVASGQIPVDSLVWRDGMRDWLPATALGLTSRDPAPVPQPPSIASARADERSAADARLPATSAPPRAAGRQPPLAMRRTTHSQRWAWGITAAITLLVASVVIGYALLSRARRQVSHANAPSSRSRLAPQARSVQSRRSRTAISESPISASPVAEGSVAASGVVPPERKSGTTSPFRTSGISVVPGAVSDAGPTGDLGRRAAAEGDIDSRPMGAESSSYPVAAARPAVLYQEVAIHRRPSFGVLTAVMTQDIQYKIMSRLRLQPPMTDGSYRVAQEVLDTRLIRADETSRGSYKTALGKLIGRELVYTLNEQGEVTHLDGYESDLAAVPVERDGSHGFQMTHVLDKDGWKELIQLSFLEPASHIAPGQHWTRQMGHDWSPLGKWSGTTTFTQDAGKDGPLLSFSYRYDMMFTPSAGAGSVLPFRVGDINFKLMGAGGTFVYDPVKQHVTRVNESFHVKGAINTELLGSVSDVTIEERQEWTIRLATQNLWR